LVAERTRQYKKSSKQPKGVSLPPNARKNSLELNGWLLTVEQGGCKGEPDKAACSSVEVKGCHSFCFLSAKTMTARNALHKAFLMLRQSGATAIQTSQAEARCDPQASKMMAGGGRVAP